MIKTQNGVIVIKNKKEIVAMLLAGGEGSRLCSLTEQTAKPAVGFGGKYRIIDFTLSNCAESGIDTVGVLTQYQPLELNEYIGSGSAWGLDINGGGVVLLPPHTGKNQADWYCGTANAVYQNMNFIDRYSPKYVIVLSGDHIYGMDYREMLEVHKRYDADCTVAVTEVDISEASRFGIMVTDEDGRIKEFEEKPPHPSGTLASMGIYIFNTDILKKHLTDDDNDDESSKDFGKNFIPRLLRSGCKMYTYRFGGYWRDVGTVESLWRANMDMIDGVLSVGKGGSPVYSNSDPMPPQSIGDLASVTHSIVADGAVVNGTVENSVIFGGVEIMENAVVRNSVVMNGSIISDSAEVNYSIVGANSVIREGCRVGDSEGNEITLVNREMKNIIDKIELQ